MEELQLNLQNTNSNRTTQSLPSKYKQERRKKKLSASLAGKGSKSAVKFGLENSKQNIELLKISIKKQIDLKDKLTKLLQTYTDVHGQEKKNAKQIKSSIIQINDAPNINKLKFMIDPTLLVQNAINIQSRKFMCTLLNTFYKTYEINQNNNQGMQSLKNQMSMLVKGISSKELMVFRMQNTQIHSQVTLEGQLLSQTSKANEETKKQLQIKQSSKTLQQQHQLHKEKYLKQLSIIVQLQNNLKQLNQQSQSVSKSIVAQQNLLAKHQNKIDREKCYQEKLTNQLNQIKKQLNCKNNQSQKLIKKLYKKRIQNQNTQILKSTTQKQKTVPLLGEQTQSLISFETTQQFIHIRD